MRKSSLFRDVSLITCYYRLIAIKEVKEKSKGSHSRSLVDNRVENRKKSNLKASTKGGISNGTVVKSTTISDVIKETDEPFMSAESFDFNQTIQSPYIGSPSMAGPLTRYRFSSCNNAEVNHINLFTKNRLLVANSLSIMISIGLVERAELLSM